MNAQVPSRYKNNTVYAKRPKNYLRKPNSPVVSNQNSY